MQSYTRPQRKTQE